MLARWTASSFILKIPISSKEYQHKISFYEQWFPAVALVKPWMFCRPLKISVMMALRKHSQEAALTPGLSSEPGLTRYQSPGYRSKLSSTRFWPGLASVRNIESEAIKQDADNKAILTDRISLKHECTLLLLFFTTLKWFCSWKSRLGDCAHWD